MLTAEYGELNFERALIKKNTPKHRLNRGFINKQQQFITTTTNSTTMVYDPKQLRANDPERVIIRLMDRPYLKFKHENDGVHKYFVSLGGDEMDFYFSLTDFEAHWALNHRDYTHHVFTDFEKALGFYLNRRIRYKAKFYEDQIRSEYRLSLRSPLDMPMW